MFVDRAPTPATSPSEYDYASSSTTHLRIPTSHGIPCMGFTSHGPALFARGWQTTALFGWGWQPMALQSLARVGNPHYCILCTGSTTHGTEFYLRDWQSITPCSWAWVDNPRDRTRCIQNNHTRVRAFLVFMIRRLHSWPHFDFCWQGTYTRDPSSRMRLPGPKGKHYRTVARHPSSRLQQPHPNASLKYGNKAHRESITEQLQAACHLDPGSSFQRKNI